MYKKGKENDVWMKRLLSDNEIDIEIVEEFIGRLNNDEQLEKLLQLINSQNRDVKLYAYEELIRFSDEKVLKAARKGLQEDDELVRIAAVEIIQEKKDFKQLEELMKLLKSDDDELVRCFSGEAIGFLSEQLIRFLEERVSLEEGNVAIVGIYNALYRLGKKEYLKSLLLLLEDDYHIIVIRTIITLKSILNPENQNLILNKIVEMKGINLPISIQEALEHYFPES
ncbi:MULTISPECIES: HEAT repeat domain-containing protein [unclassified Listeria]|uniref:HEAT repeat domain-containing protein n=1 Tax=unclassified Listeria TaxID=2642072 RepID=UPI000B5941F6|nr:MULTISPECIES: HEAT repeat domain-containing protein [unclassified Listeria]